MTAMRKDDDTVFIYGLACPKANIVRYVGQAVSPYRRLMSHAIRNDNPELAKWIAGLSCEGMIPQLIILDVATVKTASEREVAWIHHFHGRHAAAMFNRQSLPKQPKPKRTPKSTLKSGGGSSEMLRMRISRSMEQGLHDMAKATGRTVSELVRQFLAEAVGRPELAAMPPVGRPKKKHRESDKISRIQC